MKSSAQKLCNAFSMKALGHCMRVEGLSMKRVERRYDVHPHDAPSVHADPAAGGSVCAFAAASRPSLAPQCGLHCTVAAAARTAQIHPQPEDHCRCAPRALICLLHRHKRTHTVSKLSAEEGWECTLFIPCAFGQFAFRLLSAEPSMRQACASCVIAGSPAAATSEDDDSVARKSSLCQCSDGHFSHAERMHGLCCRRHPGCRRPRGWQGRGGGEGG